MNEAQDSLLAADESPPFTVDNENGGSPLLIVADHAGKHFPRRLGQLGLSNAECEGHIAWDIGAGAVCCLIGLRARCRRRSAELFPAGYRLQPNPGVGDVDP
jgi:predicted N-formylglutamate amidohydrolase